MMLKKMTTPILICLISLILFGLVFINNQLLSQVRFDLTEDQIYSLSEGSQQILSGLDEPIHLYFFFSDNASKGYVSLRNYAERVETLLKEFEEKAGGKVILQVIDPEPFSDQEDQAEQFGLTAASIGIGNESLYLGLAGRSALDEQQVIGFFDPQQERFLEYEIAKLIYQLSEPDTVKIGMLTDLPISGGPNPVTGEYDDPWAFYQQLSQLYDIETINSEALSLPSDIDLLFLAHAKTLSPELRYAIDQYAMNGNKLFVLVDPHHESSSFAGAGINDSSNLDGLLENWGIQYDPQNVVLDGQLGLEVRTQTGIARHLGYLGVGEQQINQSDVTTHFLELINGASFGSFELSEENPVTWLPLLQSSINSSVVDGTLYANAPNLTELAQSYQADDKTYTLAAKVSGIVRSAYSKDALPEFANQTDFIANTESFNAILVADSDWLADRFWVQQANFFGQSILTPFANNGDFINNGVENLSGSNALISIRGRGSFARPFDKVEQLNVIAEQKFREQEQLLQQELEETERQLSQLQSQQGENGALVVSPEQQAAIDEFVEKRIDIRKALRNVQHQLDKDINKLGSQLKFVNIAVSPLMLVFGLFLLFRIFQRRSFRGY